MILFSSLLMNLAYSQQIEVRDISYINSSQIHLGDIAVFSGIPQAQARNLAQIILSTGLEEGTYKTFSKQFVVDTINRFANTRVQVNSPETTFVSRSEMRWTSENLQKQLENNLTSVCSECNRKVNLESFSSLSNVISWDIQNIRHASGTLNATINIQKVVDGKVESSQQNIRARYELTREMPVAKQNLFFGQRISLEDIELKEVSFPENGQFISNIESIGGRRLRRNVRQGEYLRPNDLETLFAIRAGERVRMRVEKNNIEIVTEAIARENGAIGETIRVMNPINQKVLNVEVISSSEVSLK